MYWVFVCKTFYDLGLLFMYNTIITITNSLTTTAFFDLYRPFSGYCTHVRKVLVAYCTCSKLLGDMLCAVGYVACSVSIFQGLCFVYSFHTNLQSLLNPRDKYLLSRDHDCSYRTHKPFTVKCTRSGMVLSN
jgi:hypothetical protein